MERNYEPNWKPREPPVIDVPAAITHLVTTVASEKFPDVADLFPFQLSSAAHSYFSDSWATITIKSERTQAIPSCGTMTEEQLRALAPATTPFLVRTHQELYALLGANWFSFDRFTYVGPCRSGLLSWPHIAEHVLGWLEGLVLPEVLRRNESRVLRAVPQPPTFDVGKIADSLYVLECETTCRQGSAFLLKGIGVVTCAHVLGSHTQAFSPPAPSRRVPVTVVAKNDALDLAVLRVDGLERRSLDRGSADPLRQMDQIVLAGFPNYRLGDTGTIVPGLVTGFRPVSGIRRILTNAPIVAGSSGGPVLDRNSRVIGVAVTGADQMENVGTTENHGVIPIDALTWLLAGGDQPGGSAS